MASDGTEREEAVEPGGPPGPRLQSRARVGWVDVVRAAGYGCLTIALSVSLITFNKVMMMPDYFPYAAPLALLNMGFCSALAVVLLMLAPELFPSLMDPASKVNIDLRFVLRGIVPMGVAFAGNLLCANLAFRYLSVAFLQMVKRPTDLVMVYAFSLVASLERFAWWHLQVIGLVVFASSLSVSGELHFSGLGFAIQMISQVCECGRMVAMGVFLSGMKFDAFTCVLFFSPVCFVTLGFLLGVIAALPDGVVPPFLALPTMEKICEFAPLLLASGILAFALSLSSMQFIRYTSVVSYMYLGVLKDILAVLISVFVLHEEVAGIQVFAFVLQLVAVLIWLTLKVAPQEVQNKGIFGGGVAALIGGDPKADLD